MMVAVDVGNTNLHFALEKKGKIIKHGFIETPKADKAAIKSIFLPFRQETILICSVVPKITQLFNALRPILGNKVYIVGENIKAPIKSFYNKKNIGMDRLICAYAAKYKYAEARLVIDFGTAITFDFLSKEGVYEGGFILPGIGSTLNVLSSCAMLPDKIVLKKPRKLLAENKYNSKETKMRIPKNTQESIQRGIEDGFSAMINSLVKKYTEILNIPIGKTILITGGGALTIIPYLNFPYKYEPNLVIDGLCILGKKIINKY